MNLRKTIIKYATILAFASLNPKGTIPTEIIPDQVIIKEVNNKIRKAIHKIQEERVKPILSPSLEEAIVNPEPVDRVIWLQPYTSVVFIDKSYAGLREIYLGERSRVRIHNTDFGLDSSFPGEARFYGRNLESFVMTESSISSSKERSKFLLENCRVVRLDNNTIQGLGFSEYKQQDEEGLVISGNPQVTLTSNQVTDCAAVVLSGTDQEKMINPTVMYNTITNMDYNGIRATNIDNGTFAYNTIDNIDQHRGFMVRLCSNSLFFRNILGNKETQRGTFPNGGSALFIESNNNIFTENITYGGRHGIGVTIYSDSTIIAYNQIYNTGEGTPPLPSQVPSSALGIIGSGTPFINDGATNTIILGNDIRNNYQGIALLRGTGTRVEFNNFVNFSDNQQTRYNLVEYHYGERGPFNNNYWGAETCEEARSTLYDEEEYITNYAITESILTEPYTRETTPKIVECN